MGPASWILLGLAALAAGLVTWSAARHPLLWRMALRNVRRRPRQTLTVVAGLMVGTAIVSAALVAGDSAGYAIRGYVHQSLGHIDESVSIVGFPYFPEEVYDHIRTDPGVLSASDGVTAMTVWAGAAENPRTGLFEPSVQLIGFDQATTTGFGTFVGPDGATDGHDLAAGSVFVSDHLAAELGVGAGDTVAVALTPPADPLIPEVTPLSGNLTTARLPGLPSAAAGVHVVPVDANATRLSVVLAWQGAAEVGDGLTPPLEVRLVDPRGRLVGRVTGATGTVWLNHTAGPLETVAAGDWSVVVDSQASIAARYQGVAVAVYPVYDLSRLAERARRLQEPPDDIGHLADLDPFSRRVEATFTVAAVVAEGRADTFDFRYSIFLGLDDAQGLLERDGQVNYIAVSNPGGVEDGVLGTDRAMLVLDGSLADLRARHPGVPVVAALEADAEKRQFLEVADDAGQTLTGLLLFAGSLSILTGLLLILNIFIMLAEERRSELGMARAVGMHRRDVVRMFLYEGSVYGVAAAAIGALLGLGLARGIIAVMNAIIAQLGADLSIPPIGFRPTVAAVVTAAAVGVVLTFVTIWAAARHQSRLNIVRAIRRIEDPERQGSWRTAFWAGVPLMAAGGVATAAGWLPDASFTGRFSLQVFGPLLLMAGLALMLRPVLRRRILYPVLAVLVAAYYTATIFTITRFDDLTEANIVGPLRGVILTLAVVVLLVYAERFTRGVGRLLARVRCLRAIAVPAVSYPLWKKFRTGMTLAMFALVILSIGFFSIFGSLFESDPARQTGGFDIEARTTLNVEDLDAHDRGLLPAGQVETRHQLWDYATEDPDFIRVEGRGTGRLADFRHHVYGFDEAFARENGFRLLWRDDAYATDAEAYQAVIDRDDAIIVGYIYSTDERNQDLSYEVGDTLTMHLGNDVLEYTIIGIQEQYHHTAVWLPKERVRDIFPTVESLYLYRLADGADAATVARQLEQNYRAVGMDADDAEAEVLREQQSFRNILSAMKLFLGLGLIVGVLSLGIVTARSVLERRQEIGMLRALGFMPGQVRAMFFVEVTYTLLLGALAGLATAIVVTYGLWFALVRELQYPYRIPWGEVVLLVAVAYVVALAATAAPIRRSARVAPAEALRYVE